VQTLPCRENLGFKGLGFRVWANTPMYGVRVQPKPKRMQALGVGVKGLEFEGLGFRGFWARGLG
jgi:hypothetical protein